ncbi:helix-turn-helix transcriptional regulator [Salegentibacter sp. LM13S]|uniref:helix-turn-helix transcriptional regulator n=1 Tax=Salegentibacter lacus TaxID=2873599 RepID=UPI001CCD3FCD|nr:helix-turn-helix transcriptional regulator [Salegentibacter lacus]MBZ9629144.1 helix-turn-helix transcriptional regulator [Salegentibacter lacus]
MLTPHAIYDHRFMQLVKALLKMASGNFLYRIPISDARDWKDTLGMLINKTNIRLNTMFNEIKKTQVFTHPQIILLINSKKELLTHTDENHQIISKELIPKTLNDLLSVKGKKIFSKHWYKWDKKTLGCYDMGILDFRGETELLVPLHIQVRQSSALLEDSWYYILGFDPQQPVPSLRTKEQDTLKTFRSKKAKNNSKTIGDFLLAQRVHDALLKHQTSSIPSLEVIASEAGASISAMQKAFKDRYGKAVLKYDMEKRLEASTFLLKESDIEIKEVSKNYGFKTASHYISRFRKKYGITPLQFRKKAFFNKHN